MQFAHIPRTAVVVSGVTGASGASSASAATTWGGTGLEGTGTLSHRPAPSSGPSATEFHSTVDAVVTSARSAVSGLPMPHGACANGMCATPGIGNLTRCRTAADLTAAQDATSTVTNFLPSTSSVEDAAVFAARGWLTRRFPALSAYAGGGNQGHARARRMTP